MADNTRAGLRLPFELVDDIINIAVSTSGPSTLSQLALVSQYLRIRANEKRFSSIYSDNTLRFSRLIALFLSQRQVHGMLNIASFIVHLHYRRGRLDLCPDPFLDGTMAVVFSMLFRRSPHYKPPSNDFVLHLDPSHDMNVDGLHWRSFHHAITPSFMDMCFHSQITELWLFNIQHIPTGILRYATSIKHLRLDHVSINRDTVEFSLDSRISLTSLHVYGSVTFEAVTGILCGKRPTNAPYFAGLTELRVVLRTFNDIHVTNQLLRYATRVQVLSLSVRSLDAFDEEVDDGDGIFVQYRHLTSLNKIFIISLFDNVVDTAIQPANIISGVTPRNLEEINLIVTDALPTDSVDSEHILNNINFQGIDELFCGTNLVFLKRVVLIAHLVLENRTVGYNPGSFRDKCMDCIKSRLPRLCARLVPPFLIVRIDTVVLGP